MIMVPIPQAAKKNIDNPIIESNIPSSKTVTIGTIINANKRKAGIPTSNAIIRI